MASTSRWVNPRTVTLTVRSEGSDACEASDNVLTGRAYPALCSLSSCCTQVEEKVEELRELLPGERVARVVSNAPDLLLNDVQTCLRPRMTRLVAALTTVKHFQGVIDTDKVRWLSKFPSIVLWCGVLPAGRSFGWGWSRRGGDYCMRVHDFSGANTT